MEHSKLPWSYDEDKRYDGADQILDANDLTICFMATPAEDHWGDADFIVRAVNNFDALREALEKIMQMAKLKSNEPSRLIDALYNIYIEASLVLAKSKEDERCDL